MSEYSGEAPERDAFAAALARVFAEHADVSKDYAICDLTRLGELLGSTFAEPVAVSRDDSGRLFTSSGLVDPASTPPPENPCVIYIPNPAVDSLGDCIVYLTA